MSRNNEEQDLLARVRVLEGKFDNLRRQRTTVPLMRDLRDADLEKAADGQVPTYDSSTGTWKPATASGGGGVRPATVVVAPFNAKADSLAQADYVLTGTGDETILNTALADVEWDGVSGYAGGTVLLLEGDVSVSGPVNVPLGGTLQGTGWSTYITCASGFVGAAVIAVDSNATVKDLVVFTEDTTAAYGVSVTGGAVTLSNVTVGGGFARAVSITGSARVQFCTLRVNNDRPAFGVYMDGAVNCMVTGCFFNSCDVGVRVGGSSHDVLVANNRFSICYKEAILVESSNFTVIQGNLIANPGRLTANTYDGIRLNGGTRANVQGNVVSGSSAPRPRYGIRVDSGTTNAYVSNNDLLGAGQTASFSDAGTTTQTAAGNRL